MRNGKIHSYTCHNQHDVDKQRDSLRQEEAVGAEKRHVLSRCLERKLYLRNQHQSAQCQQRSQREDETNIKKSAYEPHQHGTRSNGETGKPGGDVVRLRALERLAGIYHQRTGKRHLSQAQEGTQHHPHRH